MRVASHLLRRRLDLGGAVSTQLVRYEEAKRALAAAHRVDEVKSIRDKAEAMAAYARQAKDTQLVQYATEIKVRAERRCGELLRTTEKNKGGNPNLSRRSTGSLPTLESIGITRDESSRYQQLAAMPDKHFETAVATAKDTVGQVTTAFMLRAAKKQRPTAKPMKGKKAKKMLRELDEAKARGVSILSSYARVLITALKEQKTFDEQEREILRELRASLDTINLNEVTQ